jgi:hypothetical protein
MSNATVDFEKVDFSLGEEYMRELYNERMPVACSWSDFLALPKNEGYEKNPNRVARFEDSIDKQQDIEYRGFQELPKFVAPILQDMAGNILPIQTTTQNSLSVDTIVDLSGDVPASSGSG